MVKNDFADQDGRRILIGKKIAVVTVGGACDLILNDVLRAKGLDYKSIGYTVMGVPDMAPTVLRGGVDAACIPEPLLSRGASARRTAVGVRSVLRRLRPLRARRISGDPEVRRDQSQHGRCASDVRSRGLAYAHNNPDKLREIYPTFTTLQPDLARKIVLSLARRVTSRRSNRSQI